MQIFEYREIPLPIWKEIVEYVQAIDHVYHTPKTLQYVIAKELGYEIDSRDVALAAVRF